MIEEGSKKIPGDPENTIHSGKTHLSPSDKGVRASFVVSQPATRRHVYWVALAAVVVMAALRGVLDPFIHEQFPFVTLFPAVLLSAWYGGLRPALLAVALSALVAWYFFLTPRFSLELKSVEEMIGLSVFMMVGVAIAYLGGLMNAAQHEAGRNAGVITETEQRKAAMLDTALDCIVTIDEHDKIIEFNLAAERTFGYRRDEVLGRSMGELIIPPNQREAHLKGMAHLMATGEGPILNQRLELSAMRRDGTEFPVELAIMRLPGGGPPLFTGYLRDITHRKQAEDGLRESEQRFRAMADNIPQLAWMTDKDGWIFWYNRRWFDYTGTTLPEMEGWGWTKVHHPDHADRIVESFGRCVRAGVAWEDQFPLRSKTGEYRWFLSRAMPIRDESGTIVRWFGTNTDVEDSRQTQEREKRSLELAERNGKIKDEFLATLSHELRTPMTAILGWAAILRKKADTLTDDVRQGMEVIERNARLQAQIIEDLLDMSRIVSGKLRMNVQVMNVGTVMNAAVDAVRPSAEAKEIRLQVICDPVSGEIRGDPDRLQQVIYNLLTNAVKFTSKGGRVQVVCQRVNSHVEISVADSGAGIAPEFLPYVFERFRQQDAATTRKFGGLGLGLAIVKQLVELHGGKVQVASEGVGKGATFTVHLPVSLVSAASLPDADARHHPRARGQSHQLEMPESAGMLNGMKILVVDDEPDARLMLQQLLEDQRAQVIVAASAREALTRLPEYRPHLLLCDIGMPEMDGYALIAAVRRLPAEQCGRTPAIALTAFARAEDRTRSLRAGFQMHLSKPIEPAELYASIMSLAPKDAGELSKSSVEGERKSR